MTSAPSLVRPSFWRRSSRAPLLAAILALPLAAMPAAEERGVVTGVVTDGTAGVPDAEVSLLAISTNEIVTARTGAAGRFRASIPAGRYELYVRAEGFAVASLAGSVRANEQTRADTVLRRAEIAGGRDVPSRPADPGIGDPGPHSARRGGQVSPARLLVSVPPVYPAAARDAGIRGAVRIEAVIRGDGTLSGIRELASPSPLLTEAAKECVSKWRYRPARLNGQPVEAVTRIEVQFELTEP